MSFKFNINLKGKELLTLSLKLYQTPFNMKALEQLLR